MTEACQQLFQVNKNPSDEEIEKAFKSQVQVSHPNKMQELANSNGWDDLWSSGYSIVCFYLSN